LHLDADDLLEGNFCFTNEDAGKLSYLVWCRRGNNSFRYKVQLIFNNNYHWKFCGVAHTTIKCLDCSENLERGDLTDKDFYLNSRDTGNRSTDPEKYYKDALKLKEQFYNTLDDDDDNLNSRSVFYTAQSYRDSQKYKEAIQWYNLYIKLTNTWIEEKFESYMNLGLLYKITNQSLEKIVSSYTNAINIFPDRAEPYLELGRYLNTKNNFQQAYDILSQGRKLSLDKVKNKYLLYVNEKSYGKYMDDELSVSCYWLDKCEEGKRLLEGIIDDPDFLHAKERLDKNMDFMNKKLEEKS
jgi:hypothetical protein